MQSEADTPVEERYLCIEGKVSASSLTRLQTGLPASLPANSEVFFVQFAYADLPLPKTFQVIFPKGKPQDGIICESRIIAVTQQWAKPFPEVPHGWRTICAVKFPAGTPPLVQQLPVVDVWDQSKEWIGLCEVETWERLKASIGLTIRQATVSDATAIAPIQVATWRVAYRGLISDAVLDRLDVAQRKDFWRTHLNRPDSAVFAALENGNIIGFCDLIPSRDKDAISKTVGEIAAFYVLPQQWRKGAGRALCLHTLGEARLRHYRSITLWVLADNYPARRFYEALGFQTDGATKTDSLGDGTKLQEVRYLISV